jgi:hypothetical protein
MGDPGIHMDKQLLVTKCLAATIIGILVIRGKRPGWISVYSSEAILIRPIAIDGATLMVGSIPV